jgi:hypothetical protein
MSLADGFDETLETASDAGMSEDEERRLTSYVSTCTSRIAVHDTLLKVSLNA